jgi:hypothetical protein
MSDIYLRFNDRAHACEVLGGLYREDARLSKFVAVELAREKVERAIIEFRKGDGGGKVNDGGRVAKAGGDLSGVQFEIDGKVEAPKESDLDLKVEEAELSAEWAPELIPIDLVVNGRPIDIVDVGTVYDNGVPRDGYHLIARFRGIEAVPKYIAAHETTPWKQILG